MTVVYAAPDKALRMRGALGPLQSEAVTGVLTIALEAVDGVMTQQLDGLANLLGAVDTPATSEPGDGEADPAPAKPSVDEAFGDLTDD